MDVLNLLMTPSWVTISMGAAVFVYFYSYGRNKHTFWQKQGLKGPKPLPILGNMLDLIIGYTDQVQIDWVNENGKVFGIYQLLAPALVVADPEVVTQICIKDFDMFTDRGIDLWAGNKYENNFLFFLKGDHWKKVRALMSPTFTSGKIKRMFKLMDECADDLVALCRESANSNDLVNMNDMYSLYSFDAISTCCYSFKLDRRGSANLEQVSKGNHIVRTALDAFAFKPFRFFVSLIMPSFIIKALGFKTTPEASMAPVANRVQSISEERRKSGRRVDDYLQMLLEARLNEDMDVSELNDKEAHHVGLDRKSMAQSQAEMVNQVSGSSTSSRNSKSETKLTDIEVLSQATLFMVVGLETTANLLTTSSYILAHHQDIQRRLHEEVAKLASFNENDTEKKNARFSYEDLTSCQYLDCVISECLRYLSPVANFDRKAQCDYRVNKYNVEVPKGSRIMIAMHAIHHSSDYWPEPDKFDPMRFMPDQRAKIVPGSYLPFGLGQRHCIGMRFSLTETKLALAKLLMSFRFEPEPKARWPPEVKRHVVFIKLQRPLVRLVERA